MAARREPRRPRRLHEDCTLWLYHGCMNKGWCVCRAAERGLCQSSVASVLGQILVGTPGCQAVVRGAGPRRDRHGRRRVVGRRPGAGGRVRSVAERGGDRGRVRRVRRGWSRLHWRRFLSGARVARHLSSVFSLLDLSRRLVAGSSAYLKRSWPDSSSAWHPPRMCSLFAEHDNQRSSHGPARDTLITSH